MIHDIFISNRYKYLILFTFVIILYSKTIFYDYNLDDYIILDSLEGKVNNVKDLASLIKLSFNNTDYRPVVFLSFGIEKLISGQLIPSVSHAVNALLFFLVCISALKLFELIFQNEKSFIIFFAVLLFSVHPINTEVVCSIKCRDNLLSMLLGLNSTYFFIKYLDEKNRFYYLIIAGILSVSAILSKLDALGFWLFNFAYVIFCKKDRKIKQLLIFLLVFFAVNSIHTFFTEHVLVKNPVTGLTPRVTFTENPLALDFSMTNRMIAGFNTIYFYITKLTYLSASKYYYGFNYLQILSIQSFSFFGGILITISFLVLFIYGLLKQNKIIILSVCGIASTSAYALNLMQPVAGIIADRYIFMASLFFCLLVVYLLTILFDHLKLKKHITTVLVFIILIFSLISFVRVQAWKNFRTLIDTDAPKLYNSYEAMRIAAGAYFDEYKKSEKISDLEQAIFYAEKANIVYPKNTLLHLLTGQYYFKKGDYKNAVYNFNIVIKNDPTLIEPLVFSGDVYYESKNLDSALIYYQKALIKSPKNPELINNISTIYFEKGDKEKCLKFNFDLIKQDSTLYAAYENLGYFYLEEKDTVLAKSFFKQGENHGLQPVNIYNLK